MKKTVLILISFFIVSHSTVSFASELVIITNKKGSLDALNSQQLKKLYAGKIDSFKGKKITLVACKKLLTPFLKQFIKKSEKTYKKLWIKKVFSEGATPPKMLNTCSELIDFLKKTPNAIGYTTDDHDLSMLKIVSIKM